MLAAAPSSAAASWRGGGEEGDDACCCFFLRLAAFDTQRKLGGPVRGKPLLTLPAGTAQDVGLASPSTDVDVAYFVRDRAEGALLRRMRLRW